MILQIDHIQIAAPPGAEEQARQFYGRILQMKEIPKPESLRSRGGCWFSCGSFEVHIGIQNDFTPSQKAHPAFVVSSLSDMKELLAGHNCAIREEPPIAGRHRFFTEDPFGNRIEFIEFM